MTPRDLMREAIHSVLAHRLRSALSALGLVAGVATVVAALAFARGAEDRAVRGIAALGIDNVVVRASSGAPAGDDGKNGTSAPLLSLDHVEVLARRHPGLTVAAIRSTRDAASAGDRHISATIAGVTPTWRTTSGLSVERGRWFLPSEWRARTAVISPAIARALFGDDDPVGQTLLAAGDWRTVVGVLGGSSRSGDETGSARTLDLDRVVFVPSEAMDLTLGRGDTGRAVQEIVISTGRVGDVSRTASAIRSWFARELGDRAAALEVVVPRELMDAEVRSRRGFHRLLLAMGTLALLISGVGIMNILVASVTERSSEIGVRRAFGARRVTIVRQFAVEAALLGLCGGVLGVATGLGAAYAVALVAEWPVAVTAGSVLLAVVLALAVGLAAAVYPARLAASITPVDALRQGA